MQEYTFKTLYGIDKKNNVRKWDIKVVEYTSYSEIIVTYGILNLKSIESISKIDKGKNIGKKNETTHYQQALAEATSKWNKKKDLERYTTQLIPSESNSVPKEKKSLTDTNINSSTDSLTDATSKLTLNAIKKEINATKKEIPKPMLAHDFKKFQNKLIFPCYIQKKYDGYRMLYDPVTDNLYTRTGRKYDILYETNLHKQLRRIRLPLDGELYCHKDFNFECYGVLRKKKLIDKDYDLLNKIEYHVYDLYNSTDIYTKRYNVLKDTLTKHKDTDKIKLVETYSCNTIEEINHYHTTFVNDNYEGSIIRNANSLYEFKRSFNLLKYKDFDDDEFLITGFTTEKDNNIDLVIWVCTTKDNKTFNVRPQGTKDERKDLYTNALKYINKKLWVKFFSYTENGVPRFPTTNRNSYKEYIRDVVE